MFALVLCSVEASCSRVPEVLPDVLTPLPWDLGCSSAQFGVPSLGPVGTRPDLDRCVEVAWGVRCEGRLGFNLSVDEWGQIRPVQFTGEPSVQLRNCITAALAEVIWLPATDCRGNRVVSFVAGGVTWTRWTTYVRFGGESSADGCVRECGSRNQGRGRTSGCS